MAFKKNLKILIIKVILICSRVYYVQMSGSSIVAQASCVQVSIRAPDTLLLIQLPMNLPLKTVGYGPCAWASAACAGSLDGVPGAQLGPGLHLGGEHVSSISQPLSSSHSLCLSNKHLNLKKN